jgi:hypothetical protein
MKLYRGHPRTDREGIDLTEEGKKHFYLRLTPQVLRVDRLKVLVYTAG